MQHPKNPPYPHENQFMPYLDLNQPSSTMQKIRIARNILYSREAKKRIEKVVRKERPDIVHVHNFAHQISPSILDVFEKYDIPVIMTMHDYKLVCASYLLYNDGEICQACIGKSFYHCFFRKCVKDSRMKSLLNMIEMYLHHDILHIYDSIDIFISPSIFLKNMLHNMGFTKRIRVIHNFINTKNIQPQYYGKGYLVYFGRLSREKGLHTLLRAVQDIDIEVHIVGVGTYRDELMTFAKEHNLQHVIFKGYLTGNALAKEIANACFVVLPSEWYENNPLSVLEAFAYGKPVIGANIGGIPELIGEDKRGMMFTPGDHGQLHACIEYLLSHPEDVICRGRAARLYVEKYHNSVTYYQNLMKIYESVIKV